jgi:hypothetical protein
MTLSGRRFSTGVSLSLKGVLAVPFVGALALKPGVSIGRLGIADIEEEATRRQILREWYQIP